MMVHSSSNSSATLNSPDISTPLGLATPENIFHFQAYNIIRSDGEQIDSIASRYFRGTHLWLPIVSRRSFYQRLQTFQSVPAADLAVLILSMKLLNRYPSANPHQEQEREVLYLATKTIFIQIHAVKSSSVWLIQAGIIIATYEQAHGMLENAYVSIGICARLAFSIDLQKKKRSEQPIGSEAWYEDEEAFATWWGLVICDRSV